MELQQLNPQNQYPPGHPLNNNNNQYHQYVPPQHYAPPPYPQHNQYPGSYPNQPPHGQLPPDQQSQQYPPYQQYPPNQYPPPHQYQNQNANYQNAPFQHQPQQNEPVKNRSSHNSYSEGHSNLNCSELATCSAEDRLGFIRKVYGILSVQLIITALMCLIPFYSQGARMFFLQSLWLFIACAIIGLVISCCLFCVKSMARKVPTNYILMLIFTLCEAYTVAFACAAVGQPKIVLSAAFMTAAIVIALTIYAMTTKTDFTVCGGMLFVMGAALLMFGLFSFLFGPTMMLVYCILGVVVFGIYLVFDTQLIIGGKKHEMNKEDYILGAISLYLDIINIFLYLLELFQQLQGRDD